LSIRFQADADLKFAIVEAVRHREPAIDFASATDSDLEGMSDPALLDRSAAEGRILITHDRQTMLAHFRARLAVGKSSPGLLVVSQGAPLGPVIDAILLIWAASDPSDWRDQAHHLPSLSRHVFPR
jgi:Domain of unknown function (DUF5615)